LFGNLLPRSLRVASPKLNYANYQIRKKTPPAIQKAQGKEYGAQDRHEKDPQTDEGISS